MATVKGGAPAGLAPTGMLYRYRRLYTGPLQAIVLDWAGTTVDYGCMAPVAVFVEVFRRRGITLSLPQARAPMGLEKRDHIRAIARQPAVTEQWQSVIGSGWTEADIDALFRESQQLQQACVADYAGLIPGTLAAVAAFRARGLKIGSTTGYSRPIMDVLLPAAGQQGYAPDAALCPDDVPAGRPYPWMAYANAMQLGVYPMAAIVKVGDTIPDIEEGLNAGMWTIGLTKSGNELGLSEHEASHMDPQQLAGRLQQIEQRMRQVGAHYVAETIAEVPAILDRINACLQAGEQP